MSVDRTVMDRLRVSFADDIAREQQRDRARNVTDVIKAVQSPPSRGITVRPNSGWRSDWSSNAGGACLVLEDELAAPGLEWIEWETGIARATGGTSMGEIVAELAKRGWAPKVLGADPQMSLAAAVSANHSSPANGFGSHFADSITALEIVDESATHYRYEADDNPEQIWAAAGGLGLTGVILAVEFKVRAIQTAWVLTDIRRSDNFDSLVEDLSSCSDSLPTYAQIDPTEAGSSAGRGLVLTARHARVEDLPSARRHEALRLPGSSGTHVASAAPPTIPARRYLDRFKFLTAPELLPGQLTPIDEYFQASSIGIPNSDNNSVRYDVELPDDALGLVPELLTSLASRGVPISRGVLHRCQPTKRWLGTGFGRWRLGVSVPALHPYVGTLLDQFDERLLSAGGSIVLASDTRMRPELVAAACPGLTRWLALTNRQQQPQVFANDAARRLGL